MARSFSDVEYNYKTICENIARAAQSVGKTAEDITFLAATKTVDAPTINHAISLGLRYIGENRVQELLSKYEEYDLEHASLQFIGHLQSNKVRQIVGKVDLIQSVDSVKLAEEISRCSGKLGISTDILLEVNIGREENKSGVLPEALYELLDQIREIPAVKVRGLMAIPPICENAQENCKYFDNMRNMFLDIRSKNIDNISMDILSMGMSDDYAEAIRCGANMVRVGSALFGARNYTV
ncbi:MAG: YggS family pyridoxal phosphate-dependent enzyme [Ruminococcus sp.]|nr:YggS family pyridoxal phosphate-dependent enzyme [Ruminococcus sp.]